MKIRKTPICGQCKEPIEPGEERADVERGEDMEVWHRACADDEAERLAGLESERQLGVHGSEDPMTEHAKYEVFQGEDDLWYWHLKAANGEIEAASEGYSTKEHADEGVTSAQEASQQAAEVESEAEG